MVASLRGQAPIALSVSGGLDSSALALVAHRLSDAESILCFRPDEVCEQYRAFEARVRARLSPFGRRRGLSARKA